MSNHKNFYNLNIEAMQEFEALSRFHAHHAWLEGQVLDAPTSLLPGWQEELKNHREVGFRRGYLERG